MKEKTIFALKAIGKLLMTAIYAAFSFDSLIMLELSDLAKRPFWKKFWHVDAQMERALARAARKFC